MSDAANLNPLAGGERPPGFFDDVAGAAGRIGLLRWAMAGGRPNSNPAAVAQPSAVACRRARACVPILDVRVIVLSPRSKL